MPPATSARPAGASPRSAATPARVIPTSTVYYRPGTGEQAAAQEIGRAFGLRVEPRFSGIQSATPGVIVIVTKEYQSPGKS